MWLQSWAYKVKCADGACFVVYIPAVADKQYSVPSPVTPGVIADEAFDTPEDARQAALLLSALRHSPSGPTLKG